MRFLNNYITKVQDAATIQQFSYGMMGEVIENIRTFVVPGGQDYTFAMNFEYDSWNRIKTMTYPDGEVVAYGYDIAGQLSSVVGDKGTSTYRYIDDIYYDPFGSRTRVDYGNGTQSRYTYDAVMRQLTNLKTYDASSNLIQNISYNYDDVSNISTIANAAGSVSGLGGAYSYSYQYDSLYRLVNSAGSFTDNYQNTYPYTQSMNYTASGNILNKQTIADKLLDGNALSVNNQYDYQYDKHRITQIQMGGGSKAFNWDLNGNMITATQTTDITTTRNLCWDEENRLMGVKDQNYLSNYIYDAGGERVWKLTGLVEQLSLNGGMLIDVANLNNKTLYTSPYMVITEQEYTKHYYAGTQRIASKLGAGFGGALVDMDVNVETINADVETIALDLVALLERTNTCARIESGNVTMPEPNLPAIEALRNTSIDNLESDMYFYHSDHLGSSSWITDASGAVNQHLQYLPFGEDYIYQRTNTWNIPYTFSGKEKDAETGYSYFGARYYDSELSVWLSVDPMSDSFPQQSPFIYCSYNPVMRIDVDGLLDTKYVDETGSTLYETNDGLTDVIVIIDSKKSAFVNELKVLNKENKLNDPATNKEKLHSLGIPLEKLRDSYLTGNSEIDAGYAVGYDDGYNKNKRWWYETMLWLCGSKECGQIKTGYYMGASVGELHRNSGKMNIFKDLYSQLKKNRPTIELPKSKPANTPKTFLIRKEKEI